MAIKINNKLRARNLLPGIETLFELSAQKILNLGKNLEPGAWDSRLYG